MRRRRFIAGAAGIAGAGFAGCTAPQPTHHPFAERTVSVAVEDESETDHDVEAITDRALEYWEEHSRTYVGFSIEFERDAGDDPDLRITFADDPEGCRAVENYSEHVLGCAPLLRPGNRVDETVEAIVVAGARPVRKVTITTKHELGHVLGLGHDDEPLEIMSNQPELRIPMYGLRIDLWETVLEAHATVSNAARAFDRATANWADGEYESAETEFREANVEYESAAADFDDVRERIEALAEDPHVETVDLEALRQQLDRLLERTALAETITAEMEAASTAAAAGESASANERVSTANARIRELHSLESPQLRDIAIALGLVRGFDRDEAVVDVEDDTLSA